MTSENNPAQNYFYMDESDNEEVAVKIEVKDSVFASTAEHKCNGQQYIVIRKNNDDDDDDNNYVVDSYPQIVYLPTIEYCTEHQDLFLHEDEKLVKPGDKFESHNDFIQYLNDNAKRWFFYYKCSDSKKPNTERETYIYTCVYLRNKEKYVKKGMRKRANNIKTNCPCKIKLKRLPNEKQLTVVFVCNHHDHTLSEQEFYKLQHGRRLPPYIKEEIMDLISLQVDMDKIKKYVLMQTGFNMNRTFFYQIERTMRVKNLERQISSERLVDLSQKMSMIDTLSSEEDHIREDYTQQISPKKEDLDSEMGLSQFLNIRKKKRPLAKKCLKGLKTIDSELDEVCNSTQDSTNNNLNMQDVIIVQDSLNCETHINPWIFEKCVTSEIPGRSTSNSSDREMNVYKDVKDMTIFSSQNENDKICVSGTEYILSDNYQELTMSAEAMELASGDNLIAYETVETEIVEDSFEETRLDEKTGLISHIKSEESQDNMECDSQDTIECLDKEIIQFLPDSNIEFSGYINTYNEYSRDCENKNDETIAEFESTIDNSTCDVEVQTSDDVLTKKHPLMPVFDVYMKEGNVTGFVVNDDALNNLKQVSVEKSVQTNKPNENVTKATTPNSKKIKNNSIIISGTSEGYVEQLSKNTYQKHEYIHKYNIDQYMVQPNFPKYLQILSEEINIEMFQMIKNVYKEKAMFKMTTTQRGKEGETRIWYFTIRVE